MSKKVRGNDGCALITAKHGSSKGEEDQGKGADGGHDDGSGEEEGGGGEGPSQAKDPDQERDDDESCEEEDDEGKERVDQVARIRGQGGSNALRFVPVCKFYLRGECLKVGYGDDAAEESGRDRCRFRHVKVSADAEVCPHFLNGFCPLGNRCTQRHEIPSNSVLDLRLARERGKRKRKDTNK